MLRFALNYANPTMKTNLSRLTALCVLAVFASTSAVAQLVVYDDALQNTFQDFSYPNPPNGSYDLANATVVHTGTKSIQFVGYNYGAVSFFHSGGQLTTAAYPTLHFWVNGGAASGQRIRLFVYISGAAPPIPSAAIDGYIVGGGGIVAGQWKEVTVDLTAPPFNGAAFDRIDLQSDTNLLQSAVYFDDISLLPPGAPPPASVMSFNPNVNVYTLNGERFTWQDSTNHTRSAVLAYNDGQVGTNGARGGALTQFTYYIPADGSTRTVGVTDYVGGDSYYGFGYIVAHAHDQCGADDSPIGGQQPGAGYERIWEGRHHAIFRFHQNYPRNCISGLVNTHYLPTTIDWIFSTGRDHPVWAVTYDVEHLSSALAGGPPYSPVGTLNDDSRAPYGEMNIDGNGAAFVTGVAWADRYKFTSTGAGPVTLDSGWDWSVQNTTAVPWYKEWIAGPLQPDHSQDATMGVIQTQTMNQQDAGGARDANVGVDVTTLWGKTSVTLGHNACPNPDHLMPCGNDFPYQSIGNSLKTLAQGGTNNAHMAWKTQYGFLGQTTYLLNDTVPPHNNTTASGFPRKSYSTYIVFGTHTGLPVEAQVAQVEAIQSMTLSTLTGSVVTQGPAGINVPPADPLFTYQPAGYNHIYGALAFNAANNLLDANIALGAGKTLTNPLIIISGYTGGVYPTVKLGGNTLVQDADYYPSIRTGANELWITLNRNLSTNTNHLEILGPAGVPAAPTNVVATAITTTRIDISWDLVAGVSYQVDRKAPGGAYTQIAAPLAGTNSFSDTTAVANTAYVYRVRAVNGSGPSANSAPDLATTIFFTDTPLTGVAIMALHLSQIRAAIDAVRTLAGTAGGAAYTDGTAGTTVKAVHVTELRTVLDAARAALGLPTPAYINAVANGVTVRAIDFQELRDRVQ